MDCEHWRACVELLPTWDASTQSQCRNGLALPQYFAASCFVNIVLAFALQFPSFYFGANKSFLAPWRLWNYFLRGTQWINIKTFNNIWQVICIWIYFLSAVFKCRQRFSNLKFVCRHSNDSNYRLITILYKNLSIIVQLEIDKSI